MKAVLIYDERSAGGNGSWVEAEYESPQTIEALLAAMSEHCEEAVPLPFRPTLIGDLEREAPDLAFNIAEGRSGPSRESIVPAVLDHLGIPYTGADAVALGISLNKALTKRLAVQAGVRTPPFGLFHGGEEAAEGAAGLRYPVLLKPNYGGSSVGIGPQCIIHDPADLPDLVEQYVRRYGQPCLAEHYVPGQDVTVGLLGNGSLQVFPPAMVLSEGGLYSEETKRKHAKHVVCPCELPPGVAEQVVDWTLKVFGLIGARDLARADFMLDEAGEVHFLEINPLPGLSPHYGVYPVLARAAGYSHSALIGAIMRSAVDRGRHARNRIHERLAR